VKIPPSQLTRQLDSGVVSVYLVSGDEPLQVNESLDLIRQRVKSAGFDEREILFVDARFDWQRLKYSCQQQSLFSTKKLIELRLSSGKLGAQGSKVLQFYLEHQDKDHVLLISCPKLEASVQKSKWLKQLEKQGLVVTVWPIATEKLVSWLQARMLKKGIQAQPDVVKRLAFRTEGNLLAADQEIEKLILLYGKSAISLEQIEASITDHARFDVFALVDSVLSGKANRVVRMLFSLKQEGLKDVIVLWALHNEIRKLAKMSLEVKQGESVDHVLAKHYVWEKRKPIVKKGLLLHSAKAWQQQLIICAQIDQTIKGLKQGDAWEMLFEFCLSISCKPGTEISVN
jgi:DNA polymerase III subunit delta